MTKVEEGKWERGVKGGGREELGGGIWIKRCRRRRKERGKRNLDEGGLLETRGRFGRMRRWRGGIWKRGVKGGIQRTKEDFIMGGVIRKYCLMDYLPNKEEGGG
jgi:hypothetical protein